MATQTNGTLWMWGNNNFGGLGLNDVGYPLTARSSPTQVGANTNWSQIVTSNNAYAISSTSN